MNTGDLEVVHNTAQSRFECHVQGELCVAEYQRETDTLRFHHTWVAPSLEGQGIAGRLVASGLAYARAAGFKVLPTCSYVAGYMRRHPETLDLLATR
jgi:uncharacterized protein